MENDRTTGAEDFEGTKKSWHSGSGILQAKVRGDEYDKTRFNWDWHALPGLTEEWRTDSIVYDKTYLRGASPYAGMASDGRYGCAAMEHRSLSGSYSVAEADKGFFFTETEAIALGANVRRSNTGQSREIITTVDQTLWVGTVTYSIDGAAPSTITQGANTDITLNPTDISWIHQGSVGYVLFPAAGQPLYIRGGASVNVTDPGNSTGDDVIHFALGHGTNPTSGNLDTYHYVMVPNKTAAEMPAYVADLTNRVEIVSNGSGVQGIYDSSLELLQVAFYSAGTAQTTGGLEVSSDRAALVQLRKDSGDWSLCVTDPKHEYAATEINLTISEDLEPRTYAYTLPGIYPLAGEMMVVSAAATGVSVRVELPDAANDADYNYQAALYAGAPILLNFANGDGDVSGSTNIYAVLADTYRDQDNPDTNFGELTKLVVRKSTSKQRDTFLKFGVFGLTDTIQSATLRVHTQADISSITASSVADTSWGETSLTWNNAPAIGAVLNSVNNLLADQWVELDVTAAITGDGTYSFAVSTVDGDNSRLLDSRENTNGNGAELIVVSIDPYLNWENRYELSGSDAGQLANPDEDALNNLSEYALGGNPTNGTVAAGILPALGNVDRSVFEYIHRRRTNHVELGLSYWVERNTNLVSGTWTTNGVSISGTTAAETGFETVTNYISTSVEDEQFVRLNIISE